MCDEIRRKSRHCLLAGRLQVGRTPVERNVIERDNHAAVNKRRAEIEQLFPESAISLFTHQYLLLNGCRLLLCAVRLSLRRRRLLLCSHGLLATRVCLHLGFTRGSLRSLRLAGARSDF